MGRGPGPGDPACLAERDGHGAVRRRATVDSRLAGAGDPRGRPCLGRTGALPGYDRCIASRIPSVYPVYGRRASPCNSGRLVRRHAGRRMGVRRDPAVRLLRVEPVRRCPVPASLAALFPVHRPVPDRDLGGASLRVPRHSTLCSHEAVVGPDAQHGQLRVEVRRAHQDVDAGVCAGVAVPLPAHGPPA